MTAYTISEDIGKSQSQIGKNLIPELQCSLERLVADLAVITQAADAIPRCDNEDALIEPLWEIHWSIRALIAAIPARTHSEFRLKHAVYAAEAERDKDFLFERHGSARQLKKALVEDALALLAVDHEDDGVTEKADN